ncbi:transcription factor bHLH162-like [Lycium ferocissimum]|uniref:transcription factor bHLH162-like n=1 Tax=Lycium ferocissimum TaxID=112874 RepID=UPI0028161C34|nr:transcription factor bHLH162-like [Lycium ferocissimum]
MEGCRRSSSAPARPKMERKYVEKNRRNHMKNLCNHLNSLLPSHASKETMALPDQIDAAEKYIKSLEMKLEKNKVYLEELKMSSSRKRPKSFNSTNEPNPSTKSTPQIQVHEMGPNMVVVLITNLDNLATFYNIIRLFHEEGVEVVYANFSVNGNSMLQISHENKINRSSTVESKTTTLSDKLKELIYGSSHGNDMESQLHLWDYIFESKLLGFDDVELLPIPSQNPNFYSYMQNI